MKELIVFYIEGCPYCRYAERAVRELLAADKAYRELKIRWINEDIETALADRYDYYYVPCVWQGDRKLYEASPSEDYEAVYAQMKRAMDEALG